MTYCGRKSTKLRVSLYDDSERFSWNRAVPCRIAQFAVPGVTVLNKLLNKMNTSPFPRICSLLFQWLLFKDQSCLFYRQLVSAGMPCRIRHCHLPFVNCQMAIDTVLADHKICQVNVGQYLCRQILFDNASNVGPELLSIGGTVQLMLLSVIHECIHLLNNAVVCFGYKF